MLSVPPRIIHLYGAKLFFVRQLCLPACVCSHILCQCPFLSLASMAGDLLLPQSLPTALGGNLKILDAQKGSVTRCPWLQQSCSSLCGDIDCYRAITAGTIIGLMIVVAFLKAQLVSSAERMGILLFTERKRLFLKSVILLYAGKRGKDSEG